MVSKWKSISSGPFIAKKVFAGGGIELNDLGDSLTFIVERKKLRTYEENVKKYITIKNYNMVKEKAF